MKLILPAVLLLFTSTPSLAVPSPEMKPRTLGSTAWRATNARDLAVAPDGRHVFIAHGDGFEMWSVDGGPPVRLRIEGDQMDGVRRIALTPDGKTLVAAVAGKLHRVDGKTGANQGAVPFVHRGRTIAVSPDGKLVAVAEENMVVRLIDPTTGREVRMLQGVDPEYTFDQLVFSPDGKKLAAGGTTTATHVWSLADGTLLIGPQRGAGVGDKLSGDIAWCADGTLVLQYARGFMTWPPGARTPTPLVRFADRVSRIASAGAAYPDAIVAGMPFGEVQVIRARDATVVKKVAPPVPSGSKTVIGLAVSSDGKTVAIATNDSVVRVHDMVTAKVRAEPTGHLGDVTTVGWMPDGRLVSGGEDGTVRLWDTTRGVEEGRVDLGRGAIVALDVSERGDGVLVGDKGKRVTWIALPSGQAGASHELAVPAKGIDVGRDGRAIVADIAGNIHVLKTPGLEPLDAFTFPHEVWDVSWLGARVVVASGESVGVWSPGDKAVALRGLVRTPDMYWSLYALAARPDGDLFLTNGDTGKLLAWTPTGASPQVLERPRTAQSGGGPTSAIAWTPDGGRVVTSEGMAIVVRAVRDGVPVDPPLASIPGNGAFDLAVSPDGRTVAAPDRTGLVYLWSLPVAP